MNELNYSSDSNESNDDEISHTEEEFLAPPILAVNFTLNDYGQRHPDWLSHLKGFKSGGVYSGRVIDFLTWQQMKTDFEDPQADLLAKLKVYIDACYEETVVNKDNEVVKRWAPTAFRPWMSMFYAFWKFSGKGDLKMLAPIIYSNLTKYETGYEERHAVEFTKEYLLRLHELTNTPQTLVWKAYATIATSNASRSGGNWNRDWETVVTLIPTTITTGNSAVSVYPTYQNKYKREKKRGKTQKTDKDSFITGHLETKAMTEYIACFPETLEPSACGKINNRSGRFFRYLTIDKKTGEIVSTNKQIGKHICEAFGKDIAAFLGLKNPNDYTGQCWRGTASTFLADAGLSLVQIKGVTGHKSTKALGVYIANSKVQKAIASNSLAIVAPPQLAVADNSTTVSKKRKRNSDDDNNTVGGNHNKDNRKIFNISINVTGKSKIQNLHLFSKSDEREDNNVGSELEDSESECSDDGGEEE